MGSAPRPKVSGVAMRTDDHERLVRYATIAEDLIEASDAGKDRCPVEQERVGHADRHRLLLPRRTLRRTNCCGAVAASRARMRGVPGACQGVGRAGTASVHLGCGRPASSVSFSAMAARRLSTCASPVRTGGSRTASQMRSSWVINQSTRPRSLVQSSPSVSGRSAATAARVRLSLGRPLAIVRRCPAAAVMRANIVTVGSISPDSMRTIVDLVHPARRAKTRCDRPLSDLTRATSS